MSKLVSTLLLIALFKSDIAQTVTVDPSFLTLDDEITRTGLLKICYI